MKAKAIVIDESNKEAIVAFKYYNEAMRRLCYFELSGFVSD